MNKYYSEFGGSPTNEGNTEPSQVEIAWLAGIFDGEGCAVFSINSSRNQPYVGCHITNSNMELLLKCKSIIERILGHSIKLYPKKVYDTSKVKSILKVFTLDIRKQADILSVYKLIVPFLTAKKEKVLKTMVYLKVRIPERKKEGFTTRMSKDTFDLAVSLIGVETKRVAPRRDEAIVRSL